MKNLFFLGVLLAITLATYSCSNDNVSETESLYQQKANDDHAKNGTDPDDPDGN